jgi:GrpB-like predicted nucleotidyltransferase (UPF0157 family)
MVGVTNDSVHPDLAAALVGGLRPTTVVLARYDLQWPAWFADRAADLRRVLGARALLIEHIGSTSVPGLAAKPIIDVVVAVADPDDEAAYLSDLVAAGYIVRVREPEHRCLRIGEPDRTANVHVYATGHEEIRKYLVFRDHLRHCAADRERYAAVKRALAAQGEWADINLYAEAKGPVIAEILRRAEVADGG